MNDWMTIPGKLQAAGFNVCYERISYALSNPLWRAKADRDGRTWSALGRDLEAALVELESQTNGAMSDWRATLSQEHPRPIPEESPLPVWQHGGNSGTAAVT